ncbi:MAG: shikimate kinase [Aquihabitans sp.]
MSDQGSRPPAKVVLIGLMGSGKTTVGKKLAKLTGIPFVDADVALEARSGRSVADWFSEGEDAFRNAEVDLLATLLDADEPIVVGAGGGVVVSPANRERLQAADVTAVYLHGEPAFLASRTQAKPHRPLLHDRDPRLVFEQLYTARDGLYRSVADAVVEIQPAHLAGEKPKWRIAETVVEALVDLGVLDPRTDGEPKTKRMEGPK